MQYGWKTFLFSSILSFVMGLCILTKIGPSSGIPSYESLLRADGRLSWSRTVGRSHDVLFGLIGDARAFSYPSKAYAPTAVLEALRNAKSGIISVLYEPKSFKPLFSDRSYHTVWEISIEGHFVRTFAETSAAWRRDNRLAPLLGATFVVFSLVLAYTAYRQRFVSPN